MILYLKLWPPSTSVLLSRAERAHAPAAWMIIFHGSLRCRRHFWYGVSDSVSRRDICRPRTPLLLIRRRGGFKSCCCMLLHCALPAVRAGCRASVKTISTRHEVCSARRHLIQDSTLLTQTLLVLFPSFRAISLTAATSTRMWFRKGCSAWFVITGSRHGTSLSLCVFCQAAYGRRVQRQWLE